MSVCVLHIYAGGSGGCLMGSAGGACRPLTQVGLFLFNGDIFFGRVGEVACDCKIEYNCNRLFYCSVMSLCAAG